MTLGHVVSPGEAIRPAPCTLQGQTVTLIPLTASHAPALYEQICEPTDTPEAGGRWTYFPIGPFASFDDFAAGYMARVLGDANLAMFAIVPAGRAEPVGAIALLNFAGPHRSVEVGHVLYGRDLQRTTAGTESVALLVRHAVEDLRCRRVEWKCHAGNAASAAAAERYGFTFEGLFRNHWIVKGRNRDSKWFSIIEEEWPARRLMFERWLAPSNFVDGEQVKGLRELRTETEV